MKPIYIDALSPAVGLILVLILLVTVVALFVFIPKFPRALDRAGGRRLAQVRVFTIFGHGIVRSGGFFYRFTLYENYLVTCFMIDRAYVYRNVRTFGQYFEGSGRLRLVINGVPVTLYGNSRDIDKFYEILHEFVKSSAAEK